MDFNQAYSRATWLNFLEDSFLPDDFRTTEEPIGYSSNYTKKVTKLGECSSLQLTVLEIKHSSVNDARIGLSKEAFTLVRNHTKYNRALALFVPQSANETYRFSYVEFTPVVNEVGKIQRKTSNPRRYSYLLGKGCKKHTPTRYLVNEGPVRKQIRKKISFLPHEDLKYRFSVEVLTKEFYEKLFSWYDDWAINEVKFPNGSGMKVNLVKGEQNRIHLIRLLTRFIFIWFIKQKQRIPEWIFKKDEVGKILKDFDSESLTQGNYYNGIIQNLFFATLNKPINEREFAFEKASERKEDYQIKTKYRDNLKESMFSIGKKEYISLFDSVPFLNGGLFECLDNFDTEEYIDGFSREKDRRAFIPNALFWGDGNRPGLIELFNTYNFTVEENTPQDIDVALDPELLGKVFENLLGTYNEETKKTARNESGSFYTPREIVEYMVDTSLKEYLSSDFDESPRYKLDSLFSYSDDIPDLTAQERNFLIEKIHKCKILDPACGSGAFPMGILNKLTIILEKLDPHNEQWKEAQRQKAIKDTEAAYKMGEKQERDERLKEISDVFEMNSGNYGRKLYLLENCIHGVDIQPIAIQISKLRFFISLIVDQKTDGTKDNNYNVMPLPNLETKFIAANTLIGVKRLKRGDQGLLIPDEIVEKQNELLRIRHLYFSTRNVKDKKELRKHDKALTRELSNSLKKDGFFNSTDAEMLAKWDPYCQTESSDFFDANWMFGLPQKNSSLTSAGQNTGFFDIVIGNPPYVDSEHMVAINPQIREKYTLIYDSAVGNWDLFILFVEVGTKLIVPFGLLAYIIPNKIISQNYAKISREIMLELSLCEIRDYSRQNVFPIADVYPIVFLLKNSKSDKNWLIKLISMGSITDVERKNIINKHLFSKYPWDIFFLTPEKTSILAKIANNEMKLGQFLNFYSSCTVNEAYQIQAKLKDAKDKEGKKLINSGTIDKYTSLWGYKTTRYIKQKYQNPIISNTNLSSISKRRLKQSETKKIIVANMTEEIEAFIDLDGYYLAGKSTVIGLGHDNNLKIVLALLNSKLISMWYKSANHSTKMAGEALSVTSERLEIVPCPDLNSPSLTAIKEYIEKLVDKIINTKSVNQHADISIIIQHIDTFVYHLYGLTYDEVKEIQPDFRLNRAEYEGNGTIDKGL